MKFSKKPLIQYLRDASLIFLSVLLALLLTESRENVKKRNQTEENLVSIKREISTNLEIVSGWVPYHKEVLSKIEAAIDNDSLRSQLITDKDFNLFAVAPKGLYQKSLGQTAWLVSNQSNILSNVDYETLYLLSGVYELQENSVKPSLQEILKVLFSPDAAKAENIDETLLLLHNRFKVLTELESSLAYRYTKALEILE